MNEDGTMSIIDYAGSNTSLITDTGFNEIDGLLLAELSSMDLSNAGIDYPNSGKMTISDVYDNVKDKISGNSRDLLEAMAGNPRYADMELSNYVKDPYNSGLEGFDATNDGDTSREQFAAVTITYKDENGQAVNYVSFEPTNGTDNGWIEDGDMLLSTETQAQRDSVNYLNMVAKTMDGDIVGGGHSKGGNDFEYAYLFCDDKTASRVQAAYCYDSPGLTNETLAKTDRYEQWKEKIQNGTFTCPQDSIVGQLLTENDATTWVHSNSGSVGYEHDPFTWEIENGQFKPDVQSDFSKELDGYLDMLVTVLPASQRANVLLLLRAVFELDDESGLDSVKSWPAKKIAALLADLYLDIETPIDGNILGWVFSSLLWYAAARTMQKAADWVREKIKKGFDVLNGLIDRARDWVEDKVDDVVNWGKEKVNDAIKWGKEKVDDVVSWGKDKVKKVQEKLQDTKNGIKDAWNNLTSKFSKNSSSSKHSSIHDLSIDNVVQNWIDDMNWSTIGKSSKTIQLTPSVLLDQATQMDNLKSDYAAHFSNFKSVLNSVNSNWSTGLAHNFAGKIITAGRSFDNITESLYQGAEAARSCAAGFESIDSELAKSTMNVTC